MRAASCHEDTVSLVLHDVSTTHRNLLGPRTHSGVNKAASEVLPHDLQSALPALIGCRTS